MPSSRVALFAALAVAASGIGVAFAHGDAPGDTHGEKNPAGRIGDSTQARSVRIAIVEHQDGTMGFEPRVLTVKRGEAVRFEIHNDGRVRHEFRLDTQANNQAHKAMMAEMPEMKHHEANSRSIPPGGSAQLVWQFTKPGTFEIACLIPGHYEAGMHATVTVAR